MPGWTKFQELLLVGLSFPLGCMFIYYAMASKRTIYPLRTAFAILAGVWTVVFSVYLAIRFL